MWLNKYTSLMTTHQYKLEEADFKIENNRIHSSCSCSSRLSDDLSQLTTYSDLFALAGGDAVDIWQHPELFPRLQQELEEVA